MSESQQGWATGFSGADALGVAAGLAAFAFRNTPAGRALALARLIARATRARGPLPTHTPSKARPPSGWRVNGQWCDPPEEYFSSAVVNEIVYPYGSCPIFLFTAPNNPPPAYAPTDTRVVSWKYDSAWFPGQDWYAPVKDYRRDTGFEPFAPPTRTPIPAPLRPFLPPEHKPYKPPPKRYQPPRRPYRPTPDRPKREPVKPVPARPGRVPYGPARSPWGPKAPEGPDATPGPERPWLPLGPPRRGPLHDMPQESPWDAPGVTTPGSPGAPAPTPYRFAPTLPNISPDGTWLRGPTNAPRLPEAENVPWVDAPPVPAPEPSKQPPVPPARVTADDPVSRANDRTVFEPGRPLRFDRYRHYNMPPRRKREREIKPGSPFRVQVPLVRAIAQGTEVCDGVEQFFDALPEHIKAKYDYRALRKLKGKAYAKAREAFNKRNELEKNPLFRSKWGRKATCQVQARAVWENISYLNSQDKMLEVIKNLVTNEIEDQLIGELGKGATKHSIQTKQQLGWNNKLNIGF